MKNKILVGLSILLLTTSCKNDSIFSSNKDVNNIETFNFDKASSTLPTIPSNPIYSVFNNAYKMLADDNEKLARKDPRNSDKYFYALINSAQSTLDLAFFDIGEPAAAQAFIDAHKRGVKVRVVTDTDNTKDSENPSLIRPTIQALRTAGITVVEDKKSSFMHHKFMIVDNKMVWMGSTNPTPNSMYHHNNNAMMLQSPELAENYNMKFKRMFEQLEFGGPTPPAPNPIVNINGSEVATYFSPKGGGKDAIVAALQGAKKSIKFMAFSFTHKDIADVMIQKKKQGLLVEGLFDECLVSQSSVYSYLRTNKVFSLKDGNQALLHHKTIMIDNDVLINGSFNFSKSAEESNNEDFLIIKSPEATKIFLNEYDRVKAAALAHPNTPPYDHPACGGSGANGEVEF